MKNMMKAPFPYFGGKSMITGTIWKYLGRPEHYIEPFFGSGAVLLNRPYWNPLLTETVNDKDGNIANVWRSLQFSPNETAKWCDWPINHVDLIARKKELLKHHDRLVENMIDDPEWHDPKIAGYWIWAASSWIGAGLIGINAIPNIGRKTTGVHSAGVKEKRPHLGTKGMGVNVNYEIYEWFNALSYRLRRVRVVCGDWNRVCGGDWQDNAWKNVGIYFDPPYGDEDRDTKVYAHDSTTVSKDVEAWCLERGRRKNYRIVVSGYDSEYKSLVEDGWSIERWKTAGGYGNSAKKGKGKEESRGLKNRHREMLFISPHCIKKINRLVG